MECNKCQNKSIKSGFQKNGNQKYLCKNCNTYFQKNYKYEACIIPDKQIILLTKEGCGIRSTSRILNIHPSTVLRRILKIAAKIERPYPILKGKVYQVDELFTYIKNKEKRICLAYSFEPKTRKIISFVLGRRNKTNLRRITETLILSEAQKIHTDKLNIYKELIPSNIHSTKNRGINHIERNNVNLRTHLKRLNRKTICYSKSLVVLSSVVKIYFWA